MGLVDVGRGKPPEKEGARLPLSITHADTLKKEESCNPRRHCLSLAHAFIQSSFHSCSTDYRVVQLVQCRAEALVKEEIKAGKVCEVGECPERCLDSKEFGGEKSSNQLRINIKDVMKPPN